MWYDDLSFFGFADIILSVNSIVISSVVPTIMYTLQHMVRKYFNREALLSVLV